MGSYGFFTNAQVEVLVLSRGKFERLLGSMDDLQQHGGPAVIASGRWVLPWDQTETR